MPRTLIPVVVLIALLSLLVAFLVLAASAPSDMGGKISYGKVSSTP